MSQLELEVLELKRTLLIQQLDDQKRKMELLESIANSLEKLVKLHAV